MLESFYESIFSLIRSYFQYFSFSDMGPMLGLAALCLVPGLMADPDPGFQPVILVTTGTNAAIAAGVAATEEANKKAG